jgi:tRNA G46 methylase TrmB
MKTFAMYLTEMSKLWDADHDKEQKARIISQFLKNLREQLQKEKIYLETDRERYLKWMQQQTLEDRVEEAGLDLNKDTSERIYEVGNDSKSPVRNGMILFGLYSNA